MSEGHGGGSVSGHEAQGADGFDAGEALLEAGAVLPLDATAGDGTPEAGAEQGVTLTARAYEHPTLDGRTVVRLVPEALGSAEDLALEYLGFSGGRWAPVGRVKPQSLGFPAWALVNDPANGHHALAVVQEMERLTRLVGTKPGLAKEGFDEIGERLDRSVPQFLPTFYEQVGRLFLAAEAEQQASVFFGKARAAEQRHALPIDEDRLREVFLEFAGAGALSGKALREYVRGLSERLPHPQAYAEFRLISSQRCSSGLAPYAGMLEDLRRLAKSAGLDVGEEERSLLREILHMGAMDRAAESFWKSALPALAVIAEQDAVTRERLLTIFPKTGGDQPTEFDGAWLSLLDRCGAFDLLLTGAVPVAPWLSKWLRHRDRGWRNARRLPAELALVERLADQLIADGTPVQVLRDGWRTSADLDVLDLCLARGIPVTPPAEDMGGLELEGWLSDSTEGRRDLTALVADPRFAGILRSGLERLVGTGDSTARLQLITEHQALRSVIADWLTERADDLSKPLGLPGLDELVKRLSGFSSWSALSAAPDAVSRITAFSPAAALAHTLRSGIVDELGWPALDEALTALGPVETPSARQRDAERIQLADAWPTLVVRRGAQAAAVGPEKVLDLHTLSLPTRRNGQPLGPPLVRYVGGQWLTVTGHHAERRARWSGGGPETFEPDGMLPESHPSHQHPSLELSDGSRTFGARPVHAGDTSFADLWRPVASDGTSLWVLHEGQWWDYDPASARRGRITVPAFFDSALSDGSGCVLVERSCRLLPVRPGLESSPFGSAGGVVGWWVRFDPAARTLTACSVDGTRSKPVPVRPSVDVERLSNDIPMPPLRLPGGAALYPRESRGYHTKIEFFDAAGLCLAFVMEGANEQEYAGGTRLIAPVGYWHALRPRDERGSLALRNLTEKRAGELLAAVAAGHKAEEAVAKLLPEITHPGLLAGVASLLGVAARQAAQITALAERVAQGEPLTRPTAKHAQDGPLQEALGGLLSTRRYYGRWRSWGEHESTALGQVVAVGQLLAPEADGARIPVKETEVGWLDLPGQGLGAMAVRAASPATPPAHREALLEFLEAALAVRADGDAVLVDPKGRIRVAKLRSWWNGAAQQDTDDFIGTVLRSGARRLLVLSNTAVNDQYAEWICVEYDPAGAFGPWDGYTELESDVLGSPGDPVRADVVRQLIDTVRELGPLPYHPDRARDFADQVGVSPVTGALLQLGLPGLGNYGREGLLPAEYLAPLGLKSADAKVGRAVLEHLSPRDRTRFTALQLPVDPLRVTALWTDGFETGPLVDAWLAAWGKRRVAPSWLVARAVKEIGPGRALDCALNPEAQPELTGSTEQQWKEGSLTALAPEKLLTGQTLLSYVRTLRWLAYRLPFGDPLREVLPVTLRLLRTRLGDPGLLLDLGVNWDAKGNATSMQLREAYNHPPRSRTGSEHLFEVSEALVLAPLHYYPDWDGVWVRSAPLVTGEAAGPDHPDLQLLTAAAGEKSLLQALRTLLSADFMALLTDDGPTGPAQDPLRSAPELVPAVAERFSLSEDGAVLYLMLLALPDPTDRSQAEWTGWKPARLKKAREELAATDLVVDGKRARAGRSLFLPGAWLEEKAPRLPVEGWKEALLSRATSGFLAPDHTVGELFRAAWRRVLDGDVPGFEEFTGRKARRGGR
ncbi:hypothetical protein [Streptomyces sp. NPDC005953]|uniref:hypothetical protein n=1 Tax=Streptomyces sp. NPDC005953 TaxID=3156719 RepID=UPI0033DA235B